MDIKSKNIKRLLLEVYKRYRKGKISFPQAYSESRLLMGLLKAIELTDLQERLQKIETLLNSKH